MSQATAQAPGHEDPAPRRLRPIATGPPQATAAASAQHLAPHLATIGASMRVLANRVSDLEAELARQSSTADRLRQRLATEPRADITGGCVACRRELEALRSTRLFRWSARPRRAYRWLRARRPSR